MFWLCKHLYEIVQATHTFHCCNGVNTISLWFLTETGVITSASLLLATTVKQSLYFLPHALLRASHDTEYLSGLINRQNLWIQRHAVLLLCLTGHSNAVVRVSYLLLWCHFEPVGVVDRFLFTSTHPLYTALSTLAPLCWSKINEPWTKDFAILFRFSFCLWFTL